MKKILAIALCISLFSCAKKAVKENEIPNNLSGWYINKAAVVNTPVNVDVFSFKVVDSSARLYPVLKNNFYQTLADGSISVIGSDNKIKALSKGELITINSNYCNNAGMFSLDDFKGLGDKYIGFMNYSFGTGKVYKRLGWLKINVNSDGSEIKIIEIMMNTVPNNSIKVGEVNY